MYSRLPVISFLALVTTNANAALFTVSTIDNDGPGSLRQAILDANAATSPPHRIEFGSQFPLSGTIELFGALPALTREAEIDGRDRQPVVMPFDPSNAFPLLRTNRALTLRGFTLMQGRADIRGGCVGGEGIGGASALVIERMTFSGCVAVVAAGGTASGGAISWPSLAPVTIVDSIFQGNGAIAISNGTAAGGAVAGSGPLHVESSYFIDNITNGRSVIGGAIQSTLALPGTITIRDSVFVSNQAMPDTVASAYGVGGALSLDCTTCTIQIERNFFGSNRAQQAGASLVRGNDGADAANLTVHNTTFTGNQAESTAGALFTVGSRMDVRHVTFHDNSAQTGGHAVAFTSTIREWSNSVMGDVTAGSGPGCSLGAIATIATGNYVRSGDTSCNVALPGITPAVGFDVLGVDDGELMPVVLFGPGSPVVDGADSGRCLGTDARGRARPQDGNDDGLARCDAGAYESLGDKVFADGFED